MWLGNPSRPQAVTITAVTWREGGRRGEEAREKERQEREERRNGMGRGLGR